MGQAHGETGGSSLFSRGGIKKETPLSRSRVLFLEAGESETVYTVLIAEDELLVRIGIASSVPCGEMNLHLIGEAEDGERAWALYEKYRPDIVITDIRMPGIDGLELLQRIRRVDSQCCVILITNVEQGAALEEARKLGVTGVLLKAAMKQEDIRLALSEACRHLPRDGRETRAGDERALWRQALLEGREGTGLPEARGMVMMHVFPSDRVSHRLNNSLIELALHEFGGERDSCPIRLDTGALFVFPVPFDGEAQERQLTELQRYVWDVFRVRIGFARVQGSCGAPRLRQAYQIMRRLCAWEAFFENGVLSLDTSGAYSDPHLMKLLRRMEGFSCLGDRVPQLTAFLAALRGYPGSLTDGWNLVRERGERVLQALEKRESCDSLSVLTRRICAWGEDFAGRVERALKPEILTVIHYAEAHLEEELSVSQLSSLIGYQPKYFSRLFKNEMGCNYSDYVISRRIGRARELLRETALSVQEIAAMCGFSEVSYFSSRFKQETGMTPRQMRTAP